MFNSNLTANQANVFWRNVYIAYIHFFCQGNKEKEINILWL